MLRTTTADKWLMTAEKRRDVADLFITNNIDPVIVSGVPANYRFPHKRQISGTHRDTDEPTRKPHVCANTCGDVQFCVPSTNAGRLSVAAEALQPRFGTYMDNSVPGSGSQGIASGELDDLFAQFEAQLNTAQPAEPVAGTEKEGDSPASIERRVATRRALEEYAGNLRITVPGAADAKPIDLSETGFLMETSNRLRPGSIVEVFLRYNGVRQVLRATIVRSVVHSLTPKPLFRTAFKFEEPTKLPERS